MTAAARFPVRSGETVTAFALGPLESWPFNGPVQRGVDKVDYCFVNGFVDVGDLPCRQATWDEIKSRATPALPVFETDEVALLGFNRRLDFSGFWHLPHRLSRAARTRLIPPADGNFAFRLATCGGVNIWVDGAHQVAFEPFQRNSASEIEITLPLRAGGSEVVLLLEDMAERDTSFFVELTWLGEGELFTEVPVDAAPDDLDMLMRLAQEIRPSQVVFAGADTINLTVDHAPSKDVTIEAKISPSVHLSHLPPIAEEKAVLAAGATSVAFEKMQVGDGYHPLDLTLSVGATRLHRHVGFARLASLQPERLADDAAERKRAALANAADHGEPRIGKVLAALALGRAWDEALQAIFDDTNDAIVTRRDCSDFVMVPLLWIMTRYADDLPGAVRDTAKDAILGYRYWMDEPGNDAMWFWSENHVLCFHVSAYLAGRLYPAETFPNSGLTGAAHLAKVEVQLDRWLTSVEEHGLAEWNSAAYYPIDFIGLLALGELGSGDIQSRARKILDQLFAMIALHTMNGVAAGSMGRAYDKELRAGPLSELAPFAAVAFGMGWLNSGVAALSMYCLSDYDAPENLSGWLNPKPGTSVQARYVQGYGGQGQLGLCKTTDLQLSACIDAAPGARGHQQHLMDLQAGCHPFARAWINHPGDDDPWGEERPSYWAGNGTMPRVAMSGETCMAYFDLGTSPRLGFTHAYAPLDLFDAAAIGTDYLVLASGNAAAILKATGPIAGVETGPGAGIEWRCHGTRTGWTIWLCDLSQQGLPAIEAAAAVAELTFSEDGAVLSLRRAGHPTLNLDYAQGLSVDGAPHPFPTNSTVPQVTVAEFPQHLCKS